MIAEPWLSGIGHEAGLAWYDGFGFAPSQGRKEGQTKVRVAPVTPVPYTIEWDLAGSSPSG